ncbi:MAG: hypothetical protein JO061_16895 [Acidobacteriaceae bacterium]|nr:hypothetical protein [Acidobacteriaceae bacterium]
MKKGSISKHFVQAVAGISMCAFAAVPGIGAPVNLGSSSWVWQNPLPQGNNLFGSNCLFAGGSLSCMAVGDLGTIIFGAGSGGSALSWAGQTSNTTQTLRAVACTPGDPNNCFAVGDGGTIVATTNRGGTWSSQSSGVIVGLSGISCRTTVNCFAVGGGSVIATDDGGATWFPQPHPGGTEPKAVSCPDANTCYAVANNSGGTPVILKTTNGGATWPPTPVPGAFLLTAISCGSTSHCVAVDLTGTTFATTNGTNWGPAVPVVSGAARPNLYGVSCWNATDCVAAGTAGASGNNLFFTNNTGVTWTHQTSGANSSILSAVSCSASFCLAAGDLGEIVSNYPGGSGYTNIQTTVSKQRLTRVSCANTNDCWAVGDGGIFATNNGGTVWENQHSGGSLLGISCPSATTCFAVGPGVILATTDGGKTWSDQPLSINATLSAISCPSTTVCFAGGTSILATTDGGKTWIPELIFEGFPGVFGMTCTSTSSCIAVGSEGALFTTFNGKTWTQAPPLTPNNLQDVSCASASGCIAVGDSGTTLITLNGGKSWSLQPPSTTKFLMGIGCNVDLGCYATTLDGYILQSFVLFGAAWNEEAQQDVDLEGVSCTGISGEYRCVVVGDGGTIVSKQIGPSFPDFSISLQPVLTGKFGVRGFNVVVAPLGPFKGTVDLTCSIPGGLSCSLNPTSVVVGGKSFMTGPGFLPDWNGTIVTGTSGSLRHTVQFRFEPQPPPPPPPCKPGPCQ